jgi:hypothetical protein
MSKKKKRTRQARDTEEYEEESARLNDDPCPNHNAELNRLMGGPPLDTVPNRTLTPIPSSADVARLNRLLNRGSSSTSEVTPTADGDSTVLRPLVAKKPRIRLNERVRNKLDKR